MNTDKFAQQIQDVRQRAAEMQRRTNESPTQQDLLAEALEDFQTTLEELHVSEEELRQQNEELTAARAAVEAERQRYADLFEFAPEAYLVTDIKGTIQEANRAASKLLDVSQQFMVGKPLNLFYASAAHQTFLSQLSLVCSSNHVQEWEMPLHTRTSAFFHAALTVAAVRNQEGKPIALRWLIRNISDRKRAEEELQESERRFRQLAENIHEVFWMSDVSRTQMLYVCPEYPELWGRTRQSLYEQPKSFIDAIVPEDRDRVIASLETQTAGVVEIEYRIVRPDQSIRWIRDRSFPIHDEAGQVYRLCGLAEDITAYKQVEESLRQQTAQARLLSGMCLSIRQSLNLEEILNTTVSEVRQFLNCDRVVIFQLQLDSSLVVVESVAQNWKSMLNMTVQNTNFEQNYLPLYKQGHIYVIENTDTANLDSAYLNLIDQFQVKAKLIVPILQQESEDTSSNLWGLLIAHNCAAPRQWQPSEIELLSSLATQVAIAIQQSLLYQQTQQQAQYEQALNSFISAIRKTLDLEAIFAIAAQEIKQLLHVDHVEIHQYLPSRQMWLSVAGYQIRQDNLGNLGIEIPDFDNEISRQLKRFEVVQIDDTNTLEDAVSQELTQMYPGAWLLVPLQFQDALWGSLSLMISGRYYWREWEVELVKAIATQLEITIQQGQFYQQLSTLNNNIEGQVQERTGELQQTIQGLEQLSILKDDFLSTVSHELRTPLSNMKMALEMLEVASLSEREQRYLEICQTECNREIDLINDLLDLQRLQAESYAIASTETINLQDWVPNFVDLFHSRAVERQHAIEVDISLDVPPLISNLKVLERILAELLNNACKYTSAGGEIILRFRHHPDREPPMTIFTISNQAEIPAAALSQVFEKFYRVPNADPWKQGGTGLGLSLVQKLIAHLGGTIQAESGDGWTSFMVEFPG